MTFFIWPNCLTSWPTACTEVPDPCAIRRLREPSMMVGSRRSSSVIEDHRLEPVELAVVDLERTELLSHPRHHLQQALKRAHLADLLELVEEVVERELLLADLALELLGLALVDLALGLLDQRHHVAHPEDP